MEKQKPQDILTLIELTKQFKDLEQQLEREMKTSPETKALVSKVGKTLLAYKKTAEVTIKAYERMYLYMLNNPEINVRPRDIVYKHKHPINFLKEMKLWLNIKSGANPLMAWKKFDRD